MVKIILYGFNLYYIFPIILKSLFHLSYVMNMCKVYFAYFQTFVGILISRWGWTKNENVST